MLKIYDHNESVCCQKVRLALYEKGNPFEDIHVAIDEGEQYSPEFLALNPKGVVPVATHNERVITESTIINEYIDEAFDGPNLIPEDPYWRSRKRAWSRKIDDLHCHTTALSFVVALRFVFLSALDTPEKLQGHYDNIKDPESLKMQKAAIERGYGSPYFEEAVHAFDDVLKEMENDLAKQPWLAGTEISLADLDAAPYVHRLESLQLTKMWEHYPNVTDWYNRIQSRPSWKQAITDKHLEKWVGLMNDTGKDAWSEVSKVLGRTD